MKQIEVVARSEQQAMEKAASLLNVQQSDVEIIEEYEPDELDLQNLEKEEAGTSQEGEAVLYVVQISLKRPLESAREWLQGFIDRFQPGSSVRVELREGAVLATIEGPDPSIFIGKQGHTLAALQHIVTRVLPRKIENCPAVHLDVGDYRDRKQEQLERMVESAVRRATKTRRNVSLRPMPATDRKWIHNYLKDRKGITTTSYGQEPRRYIAIEVPGGEKGGRGGGDDHRGGRMNRGGGRGGERRGGGGRDRDHAGSRGYGDGNRMGRDGNRTGGRDGNRDRDRDGNRVDQRGNRYDQRGRGGQQRERPSYNQQQPPMYIDPNAKPHEFEDVDIDERPSRMFTYDEKQVDEAMLNPERPLVDELIDELEQ